MYIYIHIYIYIYIYTYIYIHIYIQASHHSRNARAPAQAGRGRGLRATEAQHNNKTRHHCRAGPRSLGAMYLLVSIYLYIYISIISIYLSIYLSIYIYICIYIYKGQAEHERPDASAWVDTCMELLFQCMYSRTSFRQMCATWVARCRSAWWCSLCSRSSCQRCARSPTSPSTRWTSSLIK